MDAKFWFSLPLEEGVVQLLVVNVDLAQLRPDALSHLRLHCLCVFLQGSHAQCTKQLPCDGGNDTDKKTHVVFNYTLNFICKLGGYRVTALQYISKYNMS